MRRSTGRHPGWYAVTVVAAVLTSVVAAPLARGHAERETAFPVREGTPPEPRGDLDLGVSGISEPNLVVCKGDATTGESRDAIEAMPDGPRRSANLALLDGCAFSHIHEAIEHLRGLDPAVHRGSTVYVLPGTYLEDPARPEPECHRDTSILSYGEHLECPYDQNLIAILGDSDGDGVRECDTAVCDLQVEGTGDDPGDTVIEGGFRDDGEWVKLNGIRADRADGLVLKNFTVQLFEFNAVYVLETNRFLIDDVVTRWNDEYGFLTFAVVNGVIRDCEAYNNGDSGIYPGSASDLNGDETHTGRLDEEPLNGWSVEITGCDSHHNALGYSGTAGNSVYAHGNDFHHNTTGVATDSLFPNHPGLPQDHAWFRANRIFSNNENYYERYVHQGVCDLPPAERGYRPDADDDPWDGTVCNTVPLPVGSGMLIAGGNHNLLEANAVYDNRRYGFIQFGVPAILREEMDPAKQFDTSNFNHYVGNFMGVDPDGVTPLPPNGTDFWWDDQGEGNCWQANASGQAGGPTSNTLYPLGLPDCDAGGSLAVPLNPVKQVPLVPCAAYDRSDTTFRDPPGCSWLTSP